MSTKLIRGKCEDCGEEIKPSTDQKQFNRNLGLHRWRIHGISSPKADQSRKYRLAAKEKKNGNRVADILATVASNGHSQDHVNGNGAGKTFEDLLSSQTPRRGRPRKQHSAQPQNEEVTDNAIPARLKECPCCGTRFYMVKGGQ